MLQRGLILCPVRDGASGLAMFDKLRGHLENDRIVLVSFPYRKLKDLLVFFPADGSGLSVSGNEEETDCDE
jgi:hypothetical protein